MKKLKIYIAAVLSLLLALAAEALLFSVAAPLVSLLFVFPLMCVTGVVFLWVAFAAPAGDLLEVVVERVCRR